MVVGQFSKDYKYGLKHRDLDMPAVIMDVTNDNCRKEWWYKGKLHRLDGKPAIVDGKIKQFYIHGKEVNHKIANLFKS